MTLFEKNKTVCMHRKKVQKDTSQPLTLVFPGGWDLPLYFLPAVMCFYSNNVCFTFIIKTFVLVNLINLI